MLTVWSWNRELPVVSAVPGLVNGRSSDKGEAGSVPLEVVVRAAFPCY